MDDVSQFLEMTLWAKAHQNWFDADWSVRRYARLTLDNGEAAILLQSPPDDHADARVGHMIGEWSHMNAYFKNIGVNVPTIIKQDLDAGLILMQDFGTETIRDKGVDVYLKATDILINMRKTPLNGDLIKYEDSHVYEALKFYPTYCLSSFDLIGGSGNTLVRPKDDDLLEREWFTIWRAIEGALPKCPRALTHIDYGHMNLMWHKGEVGVIDFQAACDGPFVYDLVNLLEDIRINVPDDIKKSCKNHYCASLSSDHKAIFDQWYPVITAQFYARILGQIQFLKHDQGRDDLMQYYEPLQNRFESILNNDLLEPVKHFINRNCAS